MMICDYRVCNYLRYLYKYTPVPSIKYTEPYNMLYCLPKKKLFSLKEWKFLVKRKFVNKMSTVCAKVAFNVC